MDVTYKLAALSFEGNNKLAHHFDKKSYIAMIKEWKELILKNMELLK